jgi:hypothetical protein
MMNTPNTLADKTIKIPGLVDHDYCVLASISAGPGRAGTIWTDSKGIEYIVLDKNHHRPSNEKSLITIEMVSVGATGEKQASESAETTAVGMMEIISPDERYEWDYRIGYKDYQAKTNNEWLSVVYGFAAAEHAPKIDPYIQLTHDQFILATRVGDKVRGSRNSTVTGKEYRWQIDNGYRVTVKTDDDTQIGNRLFNRDDMFRSMTSGDTYIDEQQRSWVVREKRVFYIDTVNGAEVYGKELLVSSLVSD